MKTKKINSRKRKLQFIRTKNNLRRGIVSIHMSEKISDEFNEDKF